MHLLTASGLDVNPGRLRHDDVLIEDIAHALSLVCRFAGHTSTHYSVAQHSLLVVRILEREGAPAPALLAGLLHDAHEAYIGDLPTPLKHHLGPTWRTFENQVATTVQVALGVQPAMQAWEDLIHYADRVALATERRDLMPFDAERNLPWSSLDDVSPFPGPASDVGWSPSWWAATFLERYHELASACGLRAASRGPRRAPQRLQPIRVAA